MFSRPWHRISGAIAVSAIIAGTILLPAGTSAAVPDRIMVTQSVANPVLTDSNTLKLDTASAMAVAATARTAPPRWIAYRWAHSQIGCPYVWGGTGPCGNGYDCSGLVVRAWERAHVFLPRTTEEMAGSWHLVRIWHPARYARKGDIILFFSGGVAFHAGLVAYRNRWMLDAPHSGLDVRIDRLNWGDPVFYRVRR